MAMTLKRIFLILSSVILVLLAAWVIYDLLSNPGENTFIVPDTGVDTPGSFTVLTANVGNSDPYCLPFTLKLCKADVETRIAQNIRQLRPDVVAIQETLPPRLCHRYPLTPPGSVCEETSAPPQVRRLLGGDYTIVCESRNEYECIAVHVDAGEILGCGVGELCQTDRMDRQGGGCRPNLAVMAVTVRVKGRTFDVVNAHPESRSAACRLISIRQIYEGGGLTTALVQQPDALIMGDLNLDPWREDDVSSRYWRSQVGDGYPYDYHSGIAERQSPYPTLQLSIFKRTYDHVVSNFLSGTTLVLGESPGTTPLDGGEGMDHKAVYGRVSFPR